MKKLFLLTLMIMTLLFLTACWDRYELEERANILGIAIDYADESTEDFTIPEVSHQKDKFPGNNKKLYKITAQLAVPGKIKLGPEGDSSGGSGETSWVLETVGYTMKDALLNLQQQLAEKLYLGHLQIVIVNSEIAKDGLEDINDFLRRDYEVRRTAWMAITEQKASKVLQTAPPMQTVPALYLSQTLDNAMRFGKLPKGYLGKFWVDLDDMGIDGNLPLIKVIERDRIMVTGVAYFIDDNMVSKMSPIELGGYLAMRERNPGGYTVAVSTDDGGVYLVESLRRDSKINITIEDGKPNAVINVEIEAQIEEETKANDLGLKKLEEVELKVNDLANQVFNEEIKSWQEKGADLLGIGARVRAFHSKYWHQEVETEERWREIYKEMDIQVKVDFKIERTGMDWK
ncbi:Ger(x)C family spore germination protein [Ureibacillus chungkukjangi]|uniref:Spore germination protein KC n=1 Tax=Ureibacillus chungkukjangi TaxID=1202712 RepID=A0A318TPD9_9BACL|nr:Ger(x)C family spore germination protein [Ureibacillus chungkukjangi]MCM3388748.1 Ger(x)C family spore germination protein [Ureibacillus chungkukjangi]PYF06656.1 spore germination protein KC [Ureibacillus chungkukjangi]